MNEKDLYKRNERLQEQAAKIATYLPGSDLLSYSTMIMRSSYHVNALFPDLLSAQTESRFDEVMQKLEEEIDEILYALDRVSDFNKTRKIAPLDDFVKEGYDMLSLYSFACDKLIENRLVKQLR